MQFRPTRNRVTDGKVVRGELCRYYKKDYGMETRIVRFHTCMVRWNLRWWQGESSGGDLAQSSAGG